MFDRLNCFGLLLVAGFFVTALGFYRSRKNLERVAADFHAEVDATDDFSDRLDGRLDALFKGVKLADLRGDRLDRKFGILTRIVREHITNARLRFDALDQYVQGLPTFDDLAGSERGTAAAVAHRLRELADAVERDAGAEITQEDLEAGRVTFEDGTRLEDVIPGIFVGSRLAHDDLPGPTLDPETLRSLLLHGAKRLHPEPDTRCMAEAPEEAVELDDPEHYDLAAPIALKYRGVDIAVTDTAFDVVEVSGEPGYRRITLTVAGVITPDAVAPCACDPAAGECSAECLVVSPAGVSESIIGTIPAAQPAPAEPRCDDCTCGG